MVLVLNDYLIIGLVDATCSAIAATILMRIREGRWLWHKIPDEPQIFFGNGGYTISGKGNPLDTIGYILDQIIKEKPKEETK